MEVTSPPETGAAESLDPAAPPKTSKTRTWEEIRPDEISHPYEEYKDDEPLEDKDFEVSGRSLGKTRSSEGHLDL